MKFLDLTVQILPNAPGKFDVRVSSEQGEAKSNLVLPFKLADLAGVVHGVRAPVPAPAAADAALPPPPPGDPADFGRKLFNALFQGEGRDVLSRTEAQAVSRGDTGVRIRLVMDLKDAGMAEVASLPWELMCREDDFPIVVSTSSPFVRAVDTPKPAVRQPIAGPIRILALKSNPEGTQKLDLQKEVDALTALWAKMDGVEVDFIRPVEAEIRDKLASADYHVVHYMGHGGFDAQGGSGRLLLENADGTLRRVEAGEFAGWLINEPLRLVFLNACETARTTALSDNPPFAGVATALIRAGVLAVVGMQFTVTDWAAIAFAETFYKRLVQGYPVDAAVAEGRNVLYSTKPVTWATPVLYMRSPDGNLFARAATIGSVASPAVAAVAEAEAPVAPQAIPVPAQAAPVATPVANRGISIGGSVSGSVVQTGDHNVTTLTTTTLPPPESVDMAEVLRELRAIIAETQVAADAKSARKVENALAEVDDELASPTANKDDAANALVRAVTVVSQAADFGENSARLAKLAIKAAGWLGVGLAGPLLSVFGLGV